MFAEGPREPAMVDHERLLELVTLQPGSGHGHDSPRSGALPATKALLGTSGGVTSPRFLSSLAKPSGRRGSSILQAQHNQTKTSPSKTS
jgi:hypothetical protein